MREQTGTSTLCLVATKSEQSMASHTPPHWDWRFQGQYTAVDTHVTVERSTLPSPSRAAAARTYGAYVQVLMVTNYEYQL